MYSCGVYGYGLHSYGLCSYGLCSYGLRSDEEPSTEWAYSLMNAVRKLLLF